MYVCTKNKKCLMKRICWISYHKAMVIKNNIEISIKYWKKIFYYNQEINKF